MIKIIILTLLKLYRSVVSPMLGSHCRFYPSCSRYAIEAFETHSFFRALWLTAYRLMRCNPWSEGGFDPVPVLERPAKDQASAIGCCSEKL